MKKFIAIFCLLTGITGMAVFFHEVKAKPNYSYTAPTIGVQTNSSATGVQTYTPLTNSNKATGTTVHSYTPASNGENSNIQTYTPSGYIQNQIVNKAHSDVIELVMDFSGSMSGWINLAKSTMQRIVPQIAQGTRVGLRVFGQNNYSTATNPFSYMGKAFLGVGSCQATSQIVPISKLDTNTIYSGMNSVKLGGSTPLTYALKQTVNKDFASYGLNFQKKIVLVTDGGENCGGNPCAYARQLAQTRKDIRIDVIVINGSNQLRCLSDATGGTFYNVKNETDFDSALGVTFETKPPSAYTGNYSHGTGSNANGYIPLLD